MRFVLKIIIFKNRLRSHVYFFILNNGAKKNKLNYFNILNFFQENNF
jgi:hypothetical protein